MTHARHALALLALATVFAPTLAPTAGAAPVADPFAQFARPAQLVDVGGRRLNLHCSGSGSPTVIFDAPSGTAGMTWLHVMPQIARQTRSCIYDRAGLGFSDPSPLPATLANATDDLERLLERAGIAPPYVLVGNSYGGGIVQMYAYRHPETVKAMVLVEPYHEDEAIRAAAATGGKSDQMRAMEIQMEQECAQQVAHGLVPGSAPFLRCTGGIDPLFGRSLAAAYLAQQMSATQWQARLAEESSFATSAVQLRAARRPFGNLPLTVLTRTVSPYAIAGRPQSPVNKAFEAANLALNRELAALSTRGKLTLVPRAGHIIQYDRPDAVVAAVKDVLEQLPK